MCLSGQPLCSGRGHVRPNSSSGEGSSSSSQYAFCALGVGLVALGVVMILWSMVPLEVRWNNTGVQHDAVPNDSKQKTSAVAFVLVGAGLALLLLAVCLGVRNKHRRSSVTTATGTQYTDRVPEEAGETLASTPNYDVPSYDEAVTSGRYPIRQSNLQHSTSQLPSYDDLVAAVENEGEGPGSASGQNASSPVPRVGAPADETSAKPARSSSRASYIFRPLRVRRIKSEKLHVKDIRMNIQSPPQGGRVTIEPLTPPPQYVDKVPEFPTEPV
ncbi:transmembrane protein 51b [Ictalurus furcatus]|uniref:transmembrane protein 51b n=1 Tax=Ictalurus furcatus TaxID=66913 RepID=UPI00234FFD3D|nr:transmembrane protein 51b [Ictalurus furcatus]XP_053509230.1 transmembrane protein 51b [Ictalurus furcatus]XP_053509231.1 transmembrane protein 51b [Ictalurus furcatus]XP_053509232.1 transmembrane protein 51b [Ictalurus furcatus]XP_053509233.1 transmembrane protein 51b [Ictalurus furcatus]